jgi:aspartyl-tRNA(Asn)/glutamyl-tRNA(Gln) amidotransferase subunit A
VFASSIAELAQALQAKRLSSVELTQGLLARIGQHNPTLNAFITVDAERALADARAADAALARGDAGPLTGVPIAHKDVLVTAGMRSTCASRMLANYVSPYDAHVVAA